MKGAHLILVLLISIFAEAQQFILPFELERSNRPVEVPEISQLTTASDWLHAYLMVYKNHRIEYPADYFPTKNATLTAFGDSILYKFPQSEGAALVEVLRSDANQIACAMLLESKQEHASLLPYRFLAAYLTGNVAEETLTIRQMKKLGMLSPTTLNFGKNALLSAKPNAFLLTNGLQDLLALRSAQLLDGQNTNATVLNRFGEKCKAYTAPSINKVLRKGQGEIWFSPTLSADFLTLYQNDLRACGIGLIFPSGDDAGSESEDDRLRQTMEGFHMTTLNLQPLNTAEKGLYKSYRFLLYQLEVFQAQDAREAQRLEEIKAHIKQVQEG